MATLHKTSVLEEYKKHMLLCYDAIMLFKEKLINSFYNQERTKSWKLFEVMAEKPF
jgi:hypothetical protein